MTTLGDKQVPRLHFLDGARAVLMLLGIPYHAAQSYTDRPWYVKSQVFGGAVEHIGNFLHVFRMHAFYIIAGYFAAMMLSRRDPFIWLKGRTRRLIIPLVFATLVILPLQDGIVDLLNGGDGLAPLRNLAVFKLPSPAQTWFLRHLFAYSCALAAIFALFRGQTAKLANRFDNTLLVLLAYFCAATAMTGLFFFALRSAGLGSSISVGLERLVFYFPFFAGGALLWLMPDHFAKLINGNASPLKIAAAVTLLVALSLLPRDNISSVSFAAAGYLAGGVGTWLTLNLAVRHLDKQNVVVTFFVDGALTIYLIHMLFVIIFEVALVDQIGSSFIEWLLVTSLALVSATLFYAGIRRIPILYLLFNGQLPPSINTGQRRPSTA